MADITMMDTEELIREYYANKRAAEQIEHLLNAGPEQLQRRLERTRASMDKMRAELLRRDEWSEHE